MEFKGLIETVYQDYKNGSYKIVFETKRQLEIADLRDKELIIKVSEYKEKRSKDANAYAWVLIGKIADELRTSKEEVYLTMLKRYGQSVLVPLLPNQNPTGYFKYCEYYGRRNVNGKEADYYIVYKGSSEFDTKEMSILIDGVVYEAKNLGIQTLTPEELKLLKEEK